MGPISLTIILFPLFAGLAVLFGRNAQKGLRTGVIFLKSTRYERLGEPVFFWIAFSFSVAFAAASVAAIGLLAWALACLT